MATRFFLASARETRGMFVFRCVSTTADGGVNFVHFFVEGFIESYLFDFK